MPNGRTDLFFSKVDELRRTLLVLDPSTKIAKKGAGRKRLSLTAAQIFQALDQLGAIAQLTVEQQHYSEYVLHIGDDFSNWPWIPKESPAYTVIRDFRAGMPYENMNIGGALVNGKPSAMEGRDPESIGSVEVTPDAAAALQRAGQSEDDLLEQYKKGDWGDVNGTTKQVNDRALAEGNATAGIYYTRLGEAVVVVTEADASVTTLMMKDEAIFMTGKEGAGTADKFAKLRAEEQETRLFGTIESGSVAVADIAFATNLLQSAVPKIRHAAASLLAMRGHPTAHEFVHSKFWSSNPDEAFEAIKVITFAESKMPGAFSRSLVVEAVRRLLEEFPDRLGEVGFLPHICPFDPRIFRLLLGFGRRTVVYDALGNSKELAAMYVLFNWASLDKNDPHKSIGNEPAPDVGPMPDAHWAISELARSRGIDRSQITMADAINWKAEWEFRNGTINFEG